VSVKRVVREKLHALRYRVFKGVSVRYGRDAVSWQAIPLSVKWVGGYAGGDYYAWPASAWETFAAHGIEGVSIVTSASQNEGDVLDVENGDASPSQVEGWIRARKAAGYPRPTIYCSESNVPAVRAGSGPYVLNVDYDLWVASWTGYPHQVFSAGKPCAATQYAGNVANTDFDVAYDPIWPHRKAPGPPAYYRHVADGTVSLKQLAASRHTTPKFISDETRVPGRLTEVELHAYNVYTRGGDQHPMPKGLVYCTKNP